MNASRLTTAQLDDGARSIAYRCAQLAGVAAIVPRTQSINLHDDPAGFDPVAVIISATVESAIVNARSLAYFLTSDPDSPPTRTTSPPTTTAATADATHHQPTCPTTYDV